MKKYLFAILIIILPGYALHAGEPAPSSFDIKLGFSYFNVGHHSPEAAALDSSYAFNLGLDKYFSLGFETGLNWTRWDCYSPRAEKSGLEPGDRKTAADALTLPLMLNPLCHACESYSSCRMLRPGPDIPGRFSFIPIRTRITAGSPGRLWPAHRSSHEKIISPK